MSVGSIESLFKPSSVALIGAEKIPHTIGHVLAQNLFRGTFEGPIMPVHATETSIQGVLSYRSVSDLPIAADLAVIASPPDQVSGLIADLGARGTRAAIVVTPDFDREGEAAGTKLRQQMIAAAKAGGVRIIGPACLGILAPTSGLNASYAHASVAKGDLAFVTQSGSLMTMMIDWAVAHGVGFSLMASLGDMADVDVGDMLDYLAFDRETRAVLLSVTHIAHQRKFISAARAAARLKPVIVFDAGGPRAHGTKSTLPQPSVPDRGEVYDAVFRRAGLLPVSSLGDLVAAAGTLGYGIRIQGDRVAVLANGRGMAEIAGKIVLDEGGHLATLSATTITALDQVLPSGWQRRNPVNLFSDATSDRYCNAANALLADPGVDAVVAVNTPTAVGDTLHAAHALAKRQERARKPVIAVWLEANSREECRQLFAQQRIPLYDSPGPAIEALMQLVRFRRNQDMLMETPASTPELFERDVTAARKIVTRALSEKRAWLTESESKRLLSAYGIPVAPAEDVATPQEAAAVAERIGFPVSLRLQDPGASENSIGRRTTGSGLASAEAVASSARQLERKFRDAFADRWFPGFTVRAELKTDQSHKLRLRIVIDDDFGPVMVFGQGGEVAQVLRDRAIGLPPLNLNLANLLIADAAVYPLLHGYGGRPAADLEEIALVLVKVSQIAAELAEIVELDINPLLADGDGAVVSGVRIRVAASDQPAEARLAIRPYPKNLERTVLARNGQALTIRPIRPEDELALQAFVRELTPEDRRLRFFSHVKEIDHQTAARMTQIDYDREMALILIDPASDSGKILGIMRIAADLDDARAEYSGAVRSDLKGTGLGRLLLEEIIEYCRRRGMATVWGEVLAENQPMLGLCRRLGFTQRREPDDPGVMLVEKALN